MRIVKIKNKYLFESDKPEQVHSYAVYQDPKTREIRAVALTHVYIEDEKRFKQVRKGNIAIMKFPDFALPSGVQNYYFASNINGGKIDLKDKANVVIVGERYLPKTQSDKIKQFSKNRYESGKRIDKPTSKSNKKSKSKKNSRR